MADKKRSQQGNTSFMRVRVCLCVWETVCLCVCLCVFAFVGASLCVVMCTWMSMCTCVCVCVILNWRCVCVRFFVCDHIWMRVRVSVRMRVRVIACVCACVFKCVYICMFVWTQSQFRYLTWSDVLRDWTHSHDVTHTTNPATPVLILEFTLKESLDLNAVA